MRPEELSTFLRNGIEVGKIPQHPSLRRSMAAYLRKNEDASAEVDGGERDFSGDGVGCWGASEAYSDFVSDGCVDYSRELRRHEVG